MIRDPSDGSVREKPQAAAEPLPDPLLSEIESALMAGKVKPERLSQEYVYQRAWNDGIDFALRQISVIFKK